MIKNTLAIVFFVLVAVAPVMGQSAQDFFHSGARTYVDARLPEALSYVESGLELEPDNARLRALKEIAQKIIEISRYLASKALKVQICQSKGK